MLCSIKNCTKPRKYIKTGYCDKHYAKFWVYGDPLAGKYKSHGMHNSSEYRIWSNIKTRCYNKKRPTYSRYGGRGIIMCERWKNDFRAFYKDMGGRPSPAYSIERINNNGNYEPSNCKWATKWEQAINKEVYSSNISGYKGVSWDNRSQAWLAGITRNRKRKILGYFKNKEDAIKARKEAESNISAIFGE